MMGNMGSLMGDMGGFGFGGGIFGWVFMLAFWGLVIFGIYAIIKLLLKSISGDNNAAGGKALEVLKERYARGEIDREEYEQRKQDLKD